ncbi:inositol monophosphatase family protein [Streptomonospora litoralis]|uniref:inositol-phosphate phosphatase n=1 Tax=Streptomonospora litoralis TaxID=2498135 RepID=A0A4P6Q3P6_9ACTN|nr:inositol monophosphatase family protein [Streptomonospora litoralis]QBI55235.1 carbamoyl phosphate synthase-like protein [Streptomonospora litoralis]
MSAAADSTQPTVVVTTAGAPQTPEIVQHLQRQGYRVVATDIDPTAPGLYLADRCYLVPPGNSESYLPEIRGICLKERADALVPLVDEELAAVSRLADDGIAVLLPRPGFVAVCLDKYTLMRRLADAGVPVPRTGLAAEWTNAHEVPLRVAPAASGAGVLTDNTPEPRGIARAAYERFGCRGYLESGSIALKLCRIADGGAHLFVKDVRVRDWDVAAPALVLEESGGALARLDGTPFAYTGSFEHTGVIGAAAAGVCAAVAAWRRADSGAPQAGDREGGPIERTAT